MTFHHHWVVPEAAGLMALVVVERITYVCWPGETNTLASPMRMDSVPPAEPTHSYGSSLPSRVTLTSEMGCSTPLRRSSSVSKMR